jgi:hypothetical protein
MHALPVQRRIHCRHADACMLRARCATHSCRHADACMLRARCATHSCRHADACMLRARCATHSLPSCRRMHAARSVRDAFMPSCRRMHAALPVQRCSSLSTARAGRAARAHAPAIRSPDAAVYRDEIRLGMRRSGSSPARPGQAVCCPDIRNKVRLVFLLLWASGFFCKKICIPYCRDT